MRLTSISTEEIRSDTGPYDTGPYGLTSMRRFEGRLRCRVRGGDLRHYREVFSISDEQDVIQ